MSIVDRYNEYARAFEHTYVDDDWTRLEPFFAEDAVYRASHSLVSGRDQVLAGLKSDVDSFDRRFDSRRLSFSQGPTAEGNRVVVRWQAVYEKAGAPTLILEGDETAVFCHDRIACLEGMLDEAARDRLSAWMELHGGALLGG